VLVPCSVFISHRHARIDKYGLTIARPGEESAKVRELPTEAELSHLLLDLGYTQTEVEHILKKLQSKEAPIQHSRSIDEFTLHDNGF
jgi:Holliday junction resolvasome RuvABC DNA-binding subunit